MYLESVSAGRIRAAAGRTGARAAIEMMGETSSTEQAARHGRGLMFRAAEQKPSRAFVVADCRDCPQMAALPGGSFAMGAAEGDRDRIPHETPRHTVSVAPFDISRTEVTRAQFAEFVRDSGYAPDGECYGWNGVDWGRSTKLNWRDPGFDQTDRDPAICISWADAQAYVKWLTKRTGSVYRLPSEAEWEFAARAGTDTRHYWGDDGADACKYANLVDQTFKSRIPLVLAWSSHACRDNAAWTAPVASYAPNAFGLYDMTGNAWEWVEDCWHDNYAGAPADGRPWKTDECAAHVMRGGGWGDSLLTTDRVTTRGNSALVERSVFTGFRVVRVRDLD